MLDKMLEKFEPFVRCERRMTKDEALDFHNASVWQSLPHVERARVQLYHEKLCMPFSIWHEAISVALDRDVYTHEMANWQALQDEFDGKVDAPTLSEIVDTLPFDKTVIVAT